MQQHVYLVLLVDVYLGAGKQLINNVSVSLE